MKYGHEATLVICFSSGCAIFSGTLANRTSKLSADTHAQEQQYQDLLQRDTQQYLHRHWLTIHLRRTEDPFSESLRDRIADALIGCFLYGELADFPLFVYD